MLAALILIGVTRRYTRFSEDQALSAALWAIILGFLGAKILFWLVETGRSLLTRHTQADTLREGDSCFTARSSAGSAASPSMR
ncbi:MAG: hypothetical protein R2912_05190 [Eubacteriales bacterium]